MIAPLVRAARRPLLVAGWFFASALAFCWVLFALLYGMRAPRDVVLAPAVFLYAVVEFVGVGLIMVLTAAERSWIRRAGWGVATVVVIVEVSQALSLYYSGDLLSTDALAHIELIELVLNRLTIAFVAGVMGGVLLGYRAWSRRFALATLSGREKASGSAVILLSMVALLALNVNVPWINYAKFTYQAGKTSPIKGLLLTLRERAPAADPEPVKTPSAQDIATARDFGMHVDTAARYPFVKDRIYDAPLPFAAAAGRTQRPNVIVFFVESLSGRFIETGAGGVPGLTPNIRDFASGAMVVDGYYDHAFPTIVGVPGQLCSSFPRLQHVDLFNAKFMPRGANNYCLPRLLADDGFESIYLGYSHPNETFFEPQMAAAGFTTRLFFQDLLDRFHMAGTPARKHRGNGDGQMMEALTALLKERTSKTPFFLALSTIETHPGLDVLDARYKFGDGTSEVLNSTHRLDAAFGTFWEYFKTSPWAENTIVVLTADHAHVAGTEFTRLVHDPGYSKTSFDVIPLVIRDPVHALPPRFNTHSTSLDFAPTIAQLMGVANRRNAFLGLSLFTERPQTAGGVGIFNRGDVAIIDGRGAQVAKLANGQCASPAAGDTACRLLHVIRYYWEMDREDRIWAAHSPK